MQSAPTYTELIDHPLTEEDFRFMHTHWQAVIPELMLKSGFSERQKLLMQQLALRQKAEKKLPLFCSQARYLFPSTLSIEQSSSEAAARFKASLFSGERFMDLTAGMGCDAYFMGQSFQEGILVEQQTMLGRLTDYNLHDVLGAGNLNVEAGTEAFDFIRRFEGSVDMIYLDPARRDARGGKVFALSDCEPDITALLPELWLHTEMVAVKTSPLLDIDLACTQLQYVKDVYVISSGNECRELLFVMKKDFDGYFQIHAVSLDKMFTLNATRQEEKVAGVEYGPPATYLYEPDAGILKAGLFKMVAQTYGLIKLHPHSHLYTSDNLLADFPGRTFKIQDILKPDKKELKKIIPTGQAHLSIRNFPGQVADLRKKWGLREGSEEYLFATTLSDGEKVLLHVRKV